MLVEARHVCYPTIFMEMFSFLIQNMVTEMNHSRSSTLVFVAQFRKENLESGLVLHNIIIVCDL